MSTYPTIAVIQDRMHVCDHMHMGKVNKHMQVQRILAGLVLGFVFSSVLADEADDAAAFNTAYSAYQNFVAKEDYTHAMPEAKTAYEIGRQIYGEDHKNTAVLAYNYGQMLLEVGNDDEASVVLQEAVILYKAAYGKDSAELIPVLMDLGHASVQTFRTTRQKKYYDRALKLARKHYGPESAKYGRLLLDAGIEILNEALSPKAEKYLQDAYQVLRNALGDGDATTGLAAFQLARLEVATKQYPDAEVHLLAALKTFEDPDRPSTPIEMSTHAWLVSVYEELGESEKATAHCQAIGRMTSASGNQNYMPLFRRSPTYPVNARKKGKEGYVDVEFTVDREGIVREPKVTEVNGHDSFADSSIEAVKVWRYAPRFVDGEPVTTPNVRTRLTYKFAE